MTDTPEEKQATTPEEMITDIQEQLGGTGITEEVSEEVLTETDVDPMSLVSIAVDGDM
jgi:spore germination protein GerM